MPALSGMAAANVPAEVAPAPLTTRRWVRVGAALAAALVLAVGVRWGVAQLEPREGQPFSTDVGGREAVALADGSRVTLNTRTRGRAVVNDRRRHFWLEEGEAYFEVAHDPKRPFVITAGKDTITVLGTRFSVRHVDGRTQVTVVEGRVRLDLARPDGGAPALPVVVTRNEAVIAESGSVLVIGRTEGEVASELSWRKGQISFDQKTVAEIAAEFNRYNRVQLVVEGEAANLRLSGNFDTENVEAFARLAHDGLGLRLERDGDRIILSGH
jgi:transmembrane sensor